MSADGWWDDARFGLFVHYGLYALLERGEWAMHREHIPAAERGSPRFDLCLTRDY